MSTTTTSIAHTHPRDGRNEFMHFFNEYILLIVILIVIFTCIFICCRNIVNSNRNLRDTTIIYDDISEYPDEICIENLLKNNCSICLEEFTNEKILMTHCQHVYHYNCIKQWKTNTNEFTCPLCRNIIHKVYEL